jgi:myosin protein heavy chain
MISEKLIKNTRDHFESSESFDGDHEILENIVNRLNDRVKLLTAQNVELLRLLQSEETHNNQIAAENESLQQKLVLAREKLPVLDSSSKLNPDPVSEYSKERLLHLEEIRLLREEVEQLKTRNNEENMKKAIEIESLQDHLRVLKNKQYQLMGKLQRLEESRKQAEEQQIELEDRIEKGHALSSSLELQIKVETQSRINHEEKTKKLLADNELLVHENKELSSRLHKLSQEQVKSENDLAESSDQLRMMAEKVFQLLERLKIAELAKSKTLEAMQAKEQETVELQRKHAQLQKECNTEITAKANIEAEKKAVEDQLRTLKRQNAHLTQRCKEEARVKMQVEDNNKLLEEKNDTLNAKLSTVMNRLHMEEAEQGTHRDHLSKLKQSQDSLIDKNEVLQEKLHLAEESRRELSRDLFKTTEELQLIQAKFNALNLMIQEQDDLKEESVIRETVRRPVEETDDILAGGKLRFFVEYNKELCMLTLRGKKSKDRQWLEKNKCNQCIRKIMRSNNVVESLVNKISELYGVIVTHEDEVERVQALKERLEIELDSIKKKLTAAIRKLSREEESKINILLKFVGEVKHTILLESKLNPSFEGAKLNLSRVRSNSCFSLKLINQIPHFFLTRWLHRVAYLMKRYMQFLQSCRAIRRYGA